MRHEQSGVSTVAVTFESCPDDSFTDESRETKSMASILVVDDHAHGLDALALALSVAGHRVLTARNGADALNVLETTRPDLIIVDLEMPVMDGWELIARLRVNAQLRELPIGVCSASTETPPSGVTFVLRKPICGQELLSAVARAVAAPISK